MRQMIRDVMRTPRMKEILNQTYPGVIKLREYAGLHRLALPQKPNAEMMTDDCANRVSAECWRRNQECRNVGKNNRQQSRYADSKVDFLVILPEHLLV